MPVNLAKIQDLSFARYTPHTIRIPESSEVRRNATRSAKHIDDTYHTKYDANTLFYDCTIVGNALLLSGPPLINLEPHVRAAALKVNGSSVTITDIQHHERSDSVWIALPDVDLSSPISFSIESPGLEISTMREIDVSVSEMLEGKHTLMTLQLDEELTWISDWASYYVRSHGIDAVLIYDNGTTQYTMRDLLNTLSRVEGLESAVIVDWDFPYGPQGSPWVGTDVPWDSDFCQIGAFQNARYGVARDTRTLVNADIDELVISPTGERLIDAVNKSANGVLTYGGEWVSNKALGIPKGGLPRYWNFLYSTGQPCGRKWALRPSHLQDAAHPTPHSIRNVQTQVSEEFFIAHFRALNSGWKNARRTETTSPMKRQKLSSTDIAVSGALASAFPDDVVHTTVRDALERHVKPELVSAGGSVSTLSLWLSTQLSAVSNCTEHWSRHWVWRDKVVVLEYQSILGAIAVDIQATSGVLHIAASARNSTSARRFKSSLKDVLPYKATDTPSGKGVLATVDTSDKENWLSLGAEIRRFVEAVQSIATPISAKTKAGPLLLAATVRSQYPLLNLRGATEYADMAKTIQDAADGRPIAYAPNHGNWGDALIHKGTLQFFKHFGISYTAYDRNEVLRLVSEAKRTNKMIRDMVLVNGGGGSWRSATSGNRSFFSNAAAQFETAVEMPHTYEAGPVQLPEDTSVTYFARDTSLSYQSVPEAAFCHDMAFFLQLPSVFDRAVTSDVGLFLRSDPERNKRSQMSSNSIDLSLMGNHRSQISPFF